MHLLIFYTIFYTAPQPASGMKTFTQTFLSHPSQAVKAFSDRRCSSSQYCDRAAYSTVTG